MNDNRTVITQKEEGYKIQTDLQINNYTVGIITSDRIEEEKKENRKYIYFYKNNQVTNFFGDNGLNIMSIELKFKDIDDRAKEQNYVLIITTKN